MNDRVERDERDDLDEPRGRNASEVEGPSKRRKAVSRTKKSKKRRLPRAASGRSRKRSGLAARPARRRPEPPSIIPQPSLDSYDDEPSQIPPERPEQEPPPPTACAPEDRPPEGDSDDLFEYFF